MTCFQGPPLNILEELRSSPEGLEPTLHTAMLRATMREGRARALESTFCNQSLLDYVALEICLTFSGISFQP